MARRDLFLGTLMMEALYQRRIITAPWHKYQPPRPNRKLKDTFYSNSNREMDRVEAMYPGRCTSKATDRPGYDLGPIEARSE